MWDAFAAQSWMCQDFFRDEVRERAAMSRPSRARKRGAAVTFVHGPLTDAPSRDVEAIPVTSVVEMYDRVIERLAECDVLISAATPGDFVPEER